MQLHIIQSKHSLPVITFNGKRRFAGKTELIKHIINSGMSLPLASYHFSSDLNFNPREALELLFLSPRIDLTKIN